MRKLRYLTAVVLLSFLALSCAGEPETVPGGPSGEGGGTDPVQKACSMELTLPEVLRFGAPAEPLTGVCACGRPVLFASLDPGVLEIAEGTARAVDERADPAAPWPGDSDNNLLAYHEGTSTLYPCRIPLEKGRYEGISHGEVSSVCGGSPQLEPGFRLEEDAETLAPGAYTLDCIYNADPVHYEDFRLTLRLRVGKRPAEPAEHEPLQTVYRPGLTLADLPLQAGFCWSEPETALHAGEGSYGALYRPDAFTEYHALKIVVEVARAEYPEPVPVPVLEAVTYDEAQTLGQIGLPAGFRWKDGEETPAVRKGAYEAIFDAGADYLPAETQIPLEVLPKEGPEVVFPALPEQIAFTDEPVSRLLRGDREGFFVENDRILHAREEPYEITVCWQKNENYVVQRKTVTIRVSRAERFSEPGKPKVVYDKTAGRWLLIAEEGVEFSTDGETWTSEPWLEDLPEQIWYRFAQTQDYLPSPEKILVP